MSDNKDRFSDKVDNYVKFRPTYPKEAIDKLICKTNITPQSVVVDVGSGTGKFTKLLLLREPLVYAVEPNQNMREAAECELSHYKNFHSVNGSAEDTTITDKSADIITAAQAFHWFDRDKCKQEWKRILKPNGKTALIWNKRNKSGSEFIVKYEEAIKKFGKISSFAHDKITEKFFDEFFCSYETFHFKWSQRFDFDGLWGRAQSSSYSPSPDQPNHALLKTALLDIFKNHQTDGHIDFEYDTELIIGEI